MSTFKHSVWMFSSIIALQICLSATQSHSHTHAGHSHEGHSHEPPSFKYSKEANLPKGDTNIQDEHLWFNALSSTFIISILPFVILYFIPVDGSAEKKPFLKILLAFASGSLLGDAFLHLIPHALMASGDEAGHSHSHSHGDGEHHAHDNSVGLGVLGGIIMFLIVEKSIRLFDGGHSHSHTTKKLKDNKKEAKNDIKIAGYLNLAADFTHNFTDGLAIGASYIAGLNIGIITTITIFLHEIPHEIGDFAILVQSGCSRRKAMLFQLLTALGAFLGTFVSLYVKSAADGIVSSLILPFTAGGFIYIATVSVIPDLLEGGNVKLSQSVKEIMALLAGVYMMVLIAKYE